MIESGHGTHLGLRRKRNEDTYYVDPSMGLFLVADGMGGHQHGEVAAALVRDAVVDLVCKGSTLIDAAHSASRLLLEEAQTSSDMLPMGTTLAAVHLTADTFEVVWVGDSRIYLWTDELRQISHDHSLVQALVEAGRLDPSQASQHPQRNILTQALGVTPAEQLRLGVARGRLDPGTGLLLCSDGLTECVEDSSIARILARTDLSCQECVDQLLLDALDAGAEDNITAVWIRAS